VEYGGGGFALLFIAEYARIIFISAISTVIFFSAHLPAPFLIILFPLITTNLGALFIWVRGALPRIRYDRLINLTWKSLLPLSITFLILNSINIFNI
jgi:NADH-ubiquinone oxidoreductase chain 1